MVEYQQVDKQREALVGGDVGAEHRLRKLANASLEQVIDFRFGKHLLQPLHLTCGTGGLGFGVWGLGFRI